MNKHWPTVKLGDIFNRVKDEVLVKDDESYARLTIRMNGNGIVQRDRVLGHKIGTKKQFIARAGQLVLSKIDARNGAFGILPPECDKAIITGNFWAFDADKKRLDTSYFEFLTKTPMFVRFCIRASEGTTNRLYLQEDEFLAQEIMLPPLAEQQRVVEQIEELAAQIGGARILRNQAAEEAEALVQVCRFRLIQDCVSVDQIRIDELVVETQLGLDRGASQQSPEYPTAYLKMNNITSRGSIVVDRVTRIQASDEEITKFTLRSGDFLFNTRNSFELVGKTAVWEDADEQFVFNNNIMRIRFRDNVEPRFVNAAFLSPFVANQLLRFKKQTTNVCAIYWKNLKEVLIPVPQIAEQRRIVAELDALRAQVDALKRLQSETAAELDALLPSILNRAFNGELA